MDFGTEYSKKGLANNLLLDKNIGSVGTVKGIL
jgi:hypothetical protein